MSDLEALLLYQIKAYHLPLPTTELVFAPPRKWRFDFAWPYHHLAVECEGATFVPGGHHTSGLGFHRDCLKYNAAVLAGWRVFRFDKALIEDGSAVLVIAQALTSAPLPPWGTTEVPDDVHR